MRVLINGYSSNEINRQSVQSCILATHTYTVDFFGGKFDSLKMYSIDALCELVKMACESGGLNLRNKQIYDYVCNFQKKSYKLYDAKKIAESICMDHASNTYEYQIANQRLDVILHQFNEFRIKITKYAWNAKLSYEMN